MLVKNSLNFIAIVILFIISGILNISYTLPPLKISPQNSATNFNRLLYDYFHLGQKRLWSDLLWIQTLIESDLEHYKGDDLNSWMYLRFNAITDLDPRFLEAYQVGGQYLSVVKDDIKGASNIFNKGIEIYPNDYQLVSHAGIHFFTEEGNYERAYELLKTIQFHPKAPYFMPSLVSKLALKSTNSLEIAFQLLKESYQTVKEDGPIKQAIANDLYAIKAEMDLNCLNSQKGSTLCSRTDFFGEDYLVNENGEYRANKKWRKFELYKKPVSTN